MPMWLRDAYGPSLLLHGLTGTGAVPDLEEIAAAADRSGVDAALLVDAYGLAAGAVTGPQAPGAEARRYDLYRRDRPLPTGARPPMTWGCPICEAHVDALDFGDSFHGLPGNLGWRFYRNGPVYDARGWFPVVDYESWWTTLPDPFAGLRAYHEAALAAGLPCGPTDMAFVREVTLGDAYLVPRPELIDGCPFVEPKPLRLV